MTQTASARTPLDATPTAHPLAGRTALVTGSGRGIGRAIAQRLAADGATVAVHYTQDESSAAQTADCINAGSGGRAFLVRAELGVPGDVDALATALAVGLKDHHGAVELDVLVNNAGVSIGTAPEDVTPEEFDRLVAVNAKAPYFLIQRLLPIMRNGGRIINISTGLTRFAQPSETAYTMTKAALEMVTFHLAKHLAPRQITINSVAPGVTDNGKEMFSDPELREMFASLSPFHRVGAAADVADVVGFIASDASRWMTGSWLDATGGTLLGSA